MPSNSNAKRWDLLDSAAKAVRKRITPQSRLYPLLSDTASPNGHGMNIASNLSSAPMDGEEITLPYSQRLFWSAEKSQQQIGDMPPQPPTLRGRVGAVLVRIVQRMLFWYTGQLRAFHRMVSEAAGEQAHALQQLDAKQRWHMGLLSKTVDRIATVEGQFTDNHARELEGRSALTERLNALTNEVSSFRGQIVLHGQDIAQWREEDRLQRESLVDRVNNEVSSFRGQIVLHGQEIAQWGEEDRLQRESLVDRVNNEVSSFRGQIVLHGQEIAQWREEDRLQRESLVDRVNQIDRTAASAQQAHSSFEHRGALDSLFVEHARSFRGDRADIKDRLNVYAPYAKEAFAAAEFAPALDLGCGRGEWLELLRDLGVIATGIDWNPDLVRQNREHGLDAIEGDILQTLRSVPDESRSIVTAFHVLEHVTFPDLLEMIDHTVRVLKPGGIALFETPNPRNLFVSTNNFYLDPTHRHPLPSEFLTFIVQARGLREPNVIPLSPFPDYYHLQESDCPAVKFINSHFYGPQDYGIVATKG